MARILGVLLACLSAVAILAWLTLALVRARHPYELEWLEGGMRAHVERVLAGEPIYARPSLEHVAFPYPPLYAWTGALAARVLGEGFLALRAVSIGATVATLALVFALARRAGGGALGGLVAAGLYAGAYRFTGAWLDVARVDSLELLCACAGFAALVARASPGASAATDSSAANALASAMELGRAGTVARAAAICGAVLGGVLLALACLAKQSAALPAAAVLAALAIRAPRDALVAALACALLLAAAALALERASGGWFRWSVIDVLASHAWVRSEIVGFWRTLGAATWPALLLLALAGPDPAAVSAPERTRRTLARAFALGLLAEAWTQRLHSGSYDNAFLPAVLALALLAGPALARARRRGGARALVAHALVLAQLALFAYDPRAQLPTAADRAAGDWIVGWLRTIPGEAFVPYHGYLAREAGKAPSAHAMAVTDLLRSGEDEVARAFVAELEAALAERRWSVVVLDDSWWEETLPPLGSHYRRADPLFGPNDAGTFVPVTGAPWRPLITYVPREDATPDAPR